MERHDDLLKVVAQTPQGPEMLWAKPLDEPERLRVESVPLFAYGLSLHDVISAKIVNDVPEVEGVLERGGHSTFRLIVADDYVGSPFEQRFGDLGAHGCGYEGASPAFLAVDVPPAAPLDVVYELLERGERDGVWRFEEGYVAEAE